MRLGKGKRRALAALGFLLAALLLVILAIPLWLPWLLKPVASREGVRFAEYERKGYSRFVLHDVAFTNANIHFHARQAALLNPAVWMWRCLTGPGEKPAPFLRADEWSLKILPQPSKPEPSGAPSIYTNIAKITDILPPLRRWLPAAELSNGNIEANQATIQLPRLTWRTGDLNASLGIPAQQLAGTIHANLKTAPYNVEIQSDSAALQSQIALSLDATGLDLQVGGAWRTNQFQVAAHFGRTGILPESAHLKAPQFHLPGAAVHLQPYREIAGNLEGTWTNGQYDLNVAANGTPANTTTNLPPFQINLSAQGDTNFVTVKTGLLSSAWVQAEISSEATLHFKCPMLQQPANVRLSANLNDQPWIKAHGNLTGEVDLTPGSEKYPNAAFRLSGTNIGNADIEAETLAIDGKMVWPIVEIFKADAAIDDGSSVHIQGALDWATKMISSGKAAIKGPVAGRWLPTGYGYDDGIASLTFSGDITNLSHAGHIAVTNLTVPELQPLQARLDWQGQDTKLQRTEVQVMSGETALQTVFSAEVRKPAETNAASKLRGEIVIDKLRWKQAEAEVFALQKQARLLFEQRAATNEWLAHIEDFDGAGTGGGLQLAANIRWPQSGDFKLLLTNASAQVINYFRTNPVEPTKIVRLELLGGWTNSPMVFDLEGIAVTTVKPKVQSPKSKVERPFKEETISAEFRMHGDGNGLMITNLAINSQTSRVAVAQGSLPLTIVPTAGTNLIQFETKSPANFALKTQPQSVFWERFSDWTGVVLKEPSLSVDVSGTWEAPRGRVLVTAQTIQLPAKSSNLPRMERFRLDLGLDREIASLTNLSLLVQGQPVTASAQMSLGEKFWKDLKEKKPPNWKSATGQLQIKDAQISAFSSLFPSLLAPQGTFHLDVSLQPGGKLQGELALKQARTRPLPSAGPIRDIDVSLRLIDRTIKLAEATVNIGGSPVTAAGEGDLSGTDWLKGAPPPFEFVLFGTNVPLSRQPESILRSDLNLAVKKTNGAPPLISGSVRLRDSYYLSDLADLVPGKVSSPDQRPPYFSVTEPSLADWRLAIRVGGDRGLKVRSTLFNGQVSPNLRVQGTLKEPLALGDVKIENGTVKFPFASLDVQRGYVTLTSEDPYRPHLMVSAASKKFGYDVRMEMTGPADQPVIQFNSTPPLSSEQLVLMVTAGELPKGGYTLTPSQRAQTMALFLGKDLLSKFGAGDQSEERLTFSSGEEISETGKPTYSLEYKLAPRWSLVGEYDRFNAFNAGIKWKLYSK